MNYNCDEIASCFLYMLLINLTQKGKKKHEQIFSYSKKKKKTETDILDNLS